MTRSNGSDSDPDETTMGATTEAEPDSSAPTDELASSTVPGSGRGRSRREANPSTPDDRYQLLAPIGRGGMGEVFVARDQVIGRQVAIKRMLGESPSAVQINRFLREAQIQGTLDHPAIPPVHELAYDDDNRPYFVMKRLSGTTLADILDKIDAGDAATRARFPVQRLLRAFADVCLAVELAHTREIVHRDLKPSNIMLGDFGEVFVLDWGIAKVIGDSDPWLGALRDFTPDPATTAVGTVIGSPRYMAPEQARGEDIDRRADVYSLGCVLFEILTGREAHAERAQGKALRPSTVSESEIRPELDDLCAAATAVSVEARLPTARQLGEAVQRYLDGDRDLETRRRMARGHLERARSAVGGPGELEDRRVAMREAGRALALDPMLDDAADLVGRLMLEPPSTVPPEVAAEIAEAELSAVQRQSWIGALVYLVYAAFIPQMLWLGARQPLYVVAFAALIAVMFGLAIWTVRRRTWTPAGVVAGVVINVGLVVLLARIYSPFTVAPAVAAVTCVVLLGSPIFRGAKTFSALVLLMMLGVFVPFALEQVGVFHPTMAVDADRMIIGHLPVHLARTPVLVGYVMFTIALIAIAAGAMRSIANAEQTARRQLQLQTWQLRQLVDGDAPA